MKRRLTNFRMNCAWNCEGYSLGTIFSVVYVSFCQGIASRLTIPFQIVVCEHKLREMKFFLFFGCCCCGGQVCLFWFWFFICLGFGFVLVGWFFTVIELHHCKIWIPSMIASGGVIFSLYILKNAFMVNTNWCELCSHRLLFPTFTPELKRLWRIFWEFPVFKINNWGWGYSVSFLTEELR